MAELRVGTSGWNYAEWKDTLYRDVPRKRWLQRYGELFDAVELNATHYRLQSEQTLQNWCDSVPRGFVFAMKAHKYVTHNLRLKDADEPVRIQREQGRALGRHLGPVLWQLPHRFKRDDARLGRFLDVLQRRWRAARHVVELRHPSWFEPRVAELLANHGVSACMSDAADWPMWEVVTADLVYIRLHGHTRTYHSAYAPRSLQRWARRIQDWLREGRDVQVYFDNTDAGAAPRDARRLREAA